MKDPRTVVYHVHVTEKGTRLSEQENKYFFKVARDANKIEIKRAVEQMFNVAVASVNTLNCKGKPKRMRSMQYGRRPDWKRAVVTLKDGSKIDLTT